MNLNIESYSRNYIRSRGPYYLVLEKNTDGYLDWSSSISQYLGLTLEEYCFILEQHNAFRNNGMTSKYNDNDLAFRVPHKKIC